MAYPMDYDLAKLHIDDMLRDAQRERLAKAAIANRQPGSADAAGFRERFARLIGNLPLLPTGSRPVGA